MKIIAALMIITGVVLGAGALDEFRYFGPNTKQFWVGAFMTPASIFFIVGAVMLWRRATRARRVVMIAASVLIIAIIAAKVLDVIGPPAILIGVIVALISLIYVWKSRAMRGE